MTTAQVFQAALDKHGVKYRDAAALEELFYHYIYQQISTEYETTDRKYKIATESQLTKDVYLVEVRLHELIDLDKYVLYLCRHYGMRVVAHQFYEGTWINLNGAGMPALYFCNEIPDVLRHNFYNNYCVKADRYRAMVQLEEAGIRRDLDPLTLPSGYRLEKFAGCRMYHLYRENGEVVGITGEEDHFPLSQSFANKLVRKHRLRKLQLLLAD